MTTSDNEDFIDILEERRNSRDMFFAVRRWHCSPCQYSLNRSPHEIKKQVLASDRVQNIIEELSSQNELPVEKVQEAAVKIINEMAHNFRLKAIRIISFLLTKFLKQVYSNIFVNISGVKKVANISYQYPIMYLPTHRSYADFLLVSYVCYQYDLPIPVIAAGLDFLGMNTISSLLRAAGAFFIRRSFIDDRLYWEIFTEYVKSHFQGCESPMEFFIEGTRSRTAKSLIPKIGMLQTIMEEYFCSKLPDVTIVPISISYDRTLEETLYAYELLGVPKPKETTSGLFKARTILSTNFSNAYIHFGDPISCKDFFKNYCRSVRNLHPRNCSLFSRDEQILCQDLANYVVHTHQMNLVLSPFTLICLILGHPWFLRSGGIKFDHLVDMVSWVDGLVKRTGASVYFGKMTPSEAVEFNLKGHLNIIDIASDSFVSVKVLPKTEVLSASLKVKILQANTIKQAVPSMFIYHYANQSLQLLIHFCIICVSLDLKAEKSIFNRDDVYFSYCTLRRLFQREFVFGVSNAEMDFDNALQSLKEEGILNVQGCIITVLEGSHEKITFLKELLLHFLESYHVICLNLLSLEWDSEVTFTYRTLAQDCQVALERAILNEEISDHKCLSLDIINNCLALLVIEKALYKGKRNGQNVVIPSHSEILDMANTIEIFLTPHEQKNWIISADPNIIAKL